MKMNNHELGSVDFEKQIDEIFDVGANLQKFDNLRADVCDDNGKPYRTDDGGYLPNSEFDLDGTHYETDDNGGIYKADGEYYPDDWFVLNGEFYQTDENGLLIQNDSPSNVESSFVRHEPKTTTLADGTVIELPDPAMYSSAEHSRMKDAYDEEKLIDLIAVNCPEGYLELNNELDDINAERPADDPEVKPIYEVLEKDELGNPVLVAANFSDGETNYQYVFACGSETNENASGKLFKHLYENYGIGLGEIASVTEWDYRPEHAIITTSPNEERIFVVAHTINPNCPEDFQHACVDWTKQDDGSWKFGYEFPIQQEYGSDYDEQALLESVSDDLDWGLDFSDEQYEADTPEETAIFQAEKSEQYEPNSYVTIDGERYRTDDNGKIYQKRNSETGTYEGLPNTTYELNGYSYETDEKGRIKKAGGMLQERNHEGRPTINDNVNGMESNDEKGHLIGDQFNGSNLNGNLVAMDFDVNRSDYKKLEEMLSKCVNVEHKKVEYSIEPKYEGASDRPTKFVVIYIIDGETFKETFKN